jgi:hypothetical protein
MKRSLPVDRPGIRAPTGAGNPADRTVLHRMQSALGGRKEEKGGIGDDDSAAKRLKIAGGASRPPAVISTLSRSKSETRLSDYQAQAPPKIIRNEGGGGAFGISSFPSSSNSAPSTGPSLPQNQRQVTLAGLFERNKKRKDEAKDPAKDHAGTRDASIIALDNSKIGENIPIREPNYIGSDKGVVWPANTSDCKVDNQGSNMSLSAFITSSNYTIVNANNDTISGIANIEKPKVKSSFLDFINSALANDNYDVNNNERSIETRVSEKKNNQSDPSGIDYVEMMNDGAPKGDNLLSESVGSIYPGLADALARSLVAPTVNSDVSDANDVTVVGGGRNADVIVMEGTFNNEIKTEGGICGEKVQSNINSYFAQVGVTSSSSGNGPKKRRGSRITPANSFFLFKSQESVANRSVLRDWFLARQSNWVRDDSIRDLYDSGSKSRKLKNFIWNSLELSPSSLVDHNYPSSPRRSGISVMAIDSFGSLLATASRSGSLSVFDFDEALANLASKGVEGKGIVGRSGQFVEARPVDPIFTREMREEMASIVWGQTERLRDILLVGFSHNPAIVLFDLSGSGDHLEEQRILSARSSGQGRQMQGTSSLSFVSSKEEVIQFIAGTRGGYVIHWRELKAKAAPSSRSARPASSAATTSAAAASASSQAARRLGLDPLDDWNDDGTDLGFDAAHQRRQQIETPRLFKPMWEVRGDPCNPNGIYSIVAARQVLQSDLNSYGQSSITDHNSEKFEFMITATSSGIIARWNVINLETTFTGEARPVCTDRVDLKQELMRTRIRIEKYWEGLEVTSLDLCMWNKSKYIGKWISLIIATFESFCNNALL